MSRSGEVELYFGDELRTFRLGLRELRKLQEKCADKILGERGPFRIWQDLQNGVWRVDDVVQTIQLGLQGAGMKQEDAAKLVVERFEDRIGLYQHVMTASLILHAAIVEPEADKIARGKPEGEAVTPTSPSPSATSTAPELSSAGPPETSIN